MMTDENDNHCGNQDHLNIHTNNSENNLTGLTNHLIRKYKQHGFKYVLVDLSYEKLNDGYFSLKYILNNNMDAIQHQNPMRNGIVLFTGHISNITIIVLNKKSKTDMARIIFDYCKGCHHVVKCGDEYHYYFKYTDKLPTIFDKNLGFSIRNDNGSVIAPPSTFTNDKGTRCTYKFIKGIHDDNFDEIPHALILYIRSVIKKPFDIGYVKSHTNRVDKQLHDQLELLNCNHMTNSIIKQILSGIDVKYIDNYHDWTFIIWALIQHGCDDYILNYLSIRSNIYTHHICYDYAKKMVDKYADTDYRITIWTILYYLKISNHNIYTDVMNHFLVSKYYDDNKLDIDYYESYDNNVMIDLFRKDVEYFDNDKYAKFFRHTWSFRYFDKFHVYIEDHEVYYERIFNGNLVKLKNVGYYLNRRYTGLKFQDLNGVMIEFIYIYMNAKCASLFKDVEFGPSGRIADTNYNLFNGFKFDVGNNYNLKEIQIFLNHIKSLCNNNSEFEYILNWIAHLLQFPWKKLDARIILSYTTQKTGIKYLMKILNEIFDGYAGTIIHNDIRNIERIKNPNLLLVVGEIVVKPLNKIKRDQLFLGSKEIYGANIKDYCNIIFNTHKSVLDHLNIDDCTVVISDNNNVRDETYYNELNTAIEDANRMRMLHNYLKSIDLTKFDVDIYPISDPLTNKILYELHPSLKFIYDNPMRYSGKRYAAKTLYEESIAYNREHGYNYTFTSCSFHKTFKPIFNIYSKPDSNKINYYVFDDKLNTDNIIKLFVRYYNN